MARMRLPALQRLLVTVVDTTTSSDDPIIRCRFIHLVWTIVRRWDTRLFYHPRQQKRFPAVLAHLLRSVSAQLLHQCSAIYLHKLSHRKASINDLHNPLYGSPWPYSQWPYIHNNQHHHMMHAILRRTASAIIYVFMIHVIYVICIFIWMCVMTD